MGSIREYEETHLKESQRLQQERRELAGQVGGLGAAGVGLRGGGCRGGVAWWECACA